MCDHKFRLLLIAATIIFGVLIYGGLEQGFHGQGKDLFDNSRKEVATIVSTFCIALIGLLAGIVVLVTGLQDSYHARKFKSSPGYPDYLVYYFVTVVCLILTHCMTIVSFVSFTWFKIMLASMVTNIIQFLFLAVCAYSIFSNLEGQASSNEAGPPP